MILKCGIFNGKTQFRPKGPRKKKIKVKKKESTYHERSFSPLEPEYASPCKKRKYESRSGFKFQENSYDPDIKIPNYQFYQLCDITFTITPKSSKSMLRKTRQNANDIEHAPFSRAKKPNTSIKSHYLNKKKYEIENESTEKLNHDIKSSSRWHQFQNVHLESSKGHLRPSQKIDTVKAMDLNKLVEVDTRKKQKSPSKYPKQVNHDRKTKSCDISLVPHTSTHEIVIEGQSQSDDEEEMQQRQLEDIRRNIEESEDVLLVHLKKERKSRIDRIIERFENDTCEDIVDLETMKILTKSGNWVKLKGHHLNPRPHCRSNETAAMIKNVKNLHKKEKELNKGLKKKKKFIKGSSKYSSQDSINKSDSFSNRLKPIEDDFSEELFSDISSDTDKTPIKLHSMFTNSNSLLHQSNLLMAESIIDSGESHVTLPLHSSRDLASSQKFCSPNNVSFQEKHSCKDTPTTRSNIKRDYFKEMCNVFVTSNPKLSVTDQPIASYDLSTIHSSKIQRSTHLKGKSRKLSSAKLLDHKKVESSINKDPNIFDVSTPKYTSAYQRNASYNLHSSLSANENCTPLQDKSRKLCYAVPQDNKKVVKSALKNNVITKNSSCAKGKRSDGDIGICPIGEFNSLSKPKQTPTRLYCNSTRNATAKINEFYDSIPYDDLLM